MINFFLFMSGLETLVPKFRIFVEIIRIYVCMCLYFLSLSTNKNSSYAHCCDIIKICTKQNKKNEKKKHPTTKNGNDGPNRTNIESYRCFSFDNTQAKLV